MLRRLNEAGRQGEGIWVNGDANRLAQVVVNYLANALKYSLPDRHVDLSVDVVQAVPEESMRYALPLVRVSVRDEGLGLAEECQVHLFERFYRAPTIEQQSGSGVGLGLSLYICKTIIELHGGAVRVMSAPGEGSTFWFAIPSDMDQTARA